MIYKITIPNWGKWQKDIDGHRAWIALGTNFFSHPGIRVVGEECPDALLCLQWLWMVCDDGQIEIAEHHLANGIRQAAFAKNQRFNWFKRIELLQQEGLIECEQVAIKKEQLPTTPFKQAEKQAQTNPIQTNKQTKQTDKQPSLFSEPTKPPKPPPTPSRFEDFWSAYPKKVGKATCEKKWKSHQLDTIADTIIAKVKAYQQTEQWKKGFILNPETFINQRRWEDDISTVKEPAKPKQWWEQPLDTRKIIPAHERQGGGGKLL